MFLAQEEEGLSDLASQRNNMMRAFERPMAAATAALVPLADGGAEPRAIPRSLPCGTLPQRQEGAFEPLFPVKFEEGRAESGQGAVVETLALTTEPAKDVVCKCSGHCGNWLCTRRRGQRGAHQKCEAVADGGAYCARCKCEVYDCSSPRYYQSGGRWRSFCHKGVFFCFSEGYRLNFEMGDSVQTDLGDSADQGDQSGDFERSVPPESAVEPSRQGEP